MALHTHLFLKRGSNRETGASDPYGVSPSTGELGHQSGTDQWGTNAGFQGALGTTWAEQEHLSPQSTTAPDGVIFERREPKLPGAPTQSPLFSGPELYTSPRVNPNAKAEPQQGLSPYLPTAPVAATLTDVAGQQTGMSGRLKSVLAAKKFPIVFLMLLSIFFGISKLVTNLLPGETSSQAAPEPSQPVATTVEELEARIAKFGAPGNLQFWGGFNAFDYQYWTHGANSEIGSVENPFAVTAALGMDGVQELISNEFNSYAIMTDGTVTAWGSNTNGGLGNGSTEYEQLPTKVHELANVMQLATTSLTAFAVLDDGTLWTWGSNESGILGTGSKADYSATPQQIPELNDVVSVVTSNATAYALLGDGTVWAWGSNGFNLLTQGGEPSIHRPVQLANLTNVASVSPGYYASYAILQDGTAAAWGATLYGMQGDALDTGQPVMPSLMAGLSNVASIVSDHNRLCGAKRRQRCCLGE